METRTFKKGGGPTLEYRKKDSNRELRGKRIIKSLPPVLTKYGGRWVGKKKENLQPSGNKLKLAPKKKKNPGTKGGKKGETINHRVSSSRMRTNTVQMGGKKNWINN